MAWSGGEETKRDMVDRRQPDRASAWLIALLDQPDDDGLRRSFEGWVAASPDHARDWAEIAATYAAMGETLPAYPAHWPDSAPGPRPLPDLDVGADRPAASRRPSLLRLGAGLLAVALFGLVCVSAGPAMVLRWNADYATGTAERLSLRLDDGSMVHIGPESALSVEYAPGMRQVRLLQGRAFFEVTSDAQRPFVVASDGVETTVLGTAFDVHLTGHAAEVSVREGVVRVDRQGMDGGGQTLRAGDWIAWPRQGAISQGHIDPQDVAAWRDGQLVVRDRPVAEVVTELRHYYSGVILVQGDGLAESPLTGIYSLSDPVSALRAIASTQGASFRQLSPWIVVISEF